MKYLLTLLFTVQCHAGLLKLTPSGTELLDFPLNQTAQYNNTKMTLRDANIVSKKVGIVNVKIMVVEKFTEFERKVPSLYEAGLMAVRLTFLRTIDSETMQNTITEYLDNSINEEDKHTYVSDISKAMKAIVSEDIIEQGKILTIVGDNSKRQLIYENSEGKVFVIDTENKGFVNKVMGIWL